MPTDPYESRDPGLADAADRRTLDALLGAHALLLDEAPAAVPTVTATPAASRTPRRRRPAVVGAVVAAGVLFGGSAAVHTLHHARHDPRAASTTAAVDVLTSDPALAPHTGWKWVSIKGVELQVPEGWGWGDDTALPCDTVASGPHVGIPMQSVTAQGCSRASVSASQAPVVDVQELGTSFPWARDQRRVGGHLVVVAWGADHESAELRDIARQVLASARVFGVDVNGCPSAMPSPSAGGIEQVDGATRVAVCQYEYRMGNGSGDDGSWVPRASTMLVGDAASRLAAAVVTAPKGSGPNSPVTSCAAPEVGRIMVRFETPTGVHTLALHYDGCTIGNGYVAGDGRYRQLTRANCHDLLVAPVNLEAISSAPASKCLG